METITKSEINNTTGVTESADNTKSIRLTHCQTLETLMKSRNKRRLFLRRLICALMSSLVMFFCGFAFFRSDFSQSQMIMMAIPIMSGITILSAIYVVMDISIETDFLIKAAYEIRAHNDDASKLQKP